MSTQNKLHLKNQEITKLQQEYILSLINSIEKYEGKITQYERKLTKKDKDIEKLKEKVKELEKIIKLNDFNKQKAVSSEKSYSALINEQIKEIDHLKTEYLEETELVNYYLDKVMLDIKNLQYKLTDDELMLLTCIAAMNDKLDVISAKSVVISRYMRLNHRLKILLKVYIADCKSIEGSSIEIPFKEYIIENSDVINIKDYFLREKLIKDLSKNCHAIFNDIQKITSWDNDRFELGWLKTQKKSKWVMIEGVYSQEKDIVYVKDEELIRLGIKKKDKDVRKQVAKTQKEYIKKMKPSIESVVKEIYLTEEDFTKKTVVRIKEIIKSKRFKNECINIIGIAKDIDTLQYNIMQSDGYSVLIMSVFYGVLDKVIEASSFLKDLYSNDSIESRFINLIYEELNYNPSKGIELPVKIFYKEYKDKLVNINPIIKNNIYEKINGLFKDIPDSIIEGDNLGVCEIHKLNLPNKEMYVKVGNENGNIKYMKIFMSYCKECNKGFLGEKRINIINTTISGYKLLKGDYINNIVSKNDYDSESLKAESELKKLGYTLSLTRKEREMLITSTLIPKLGKSKVKSHIKWLIKVNSRRDDRTNAIYEWQMDLIYINNIK